MTQSFSVTRLFAFDEICTAFAFCIKYEREILSSLKWMIMFHIYPNLLFIKTQGKLAGSVLNKLGRNKETLTLERDLRPTNYLEFTQSVSLVVLLLDIWNLKKLHLLKVIPLLPFARLYSNLGCDPRVPSSYRLTGFWLAPQKRLLTKYRETANIRRRSVGRVPARLSGGRTSKSHCTL